MRARGVGIVEQAGEREVGLAGARRAGIALEEALEPGARLGRLAGAAPGDRGPVRRVLAEPGVGGRGLEFDRSALELAGAQRVPAAAERRGPRGRDRGVVPGPGLALADDLG